MSLHTLENVKLIALRFRLYFHLIHSFSSIDDIVANAKQGSVMSKKTKSGWLGNFVSR